MIKVTTKGVTQAKRRMDRRIERVDSVPEFIHAGVPAIIYEATRQRFDSDGNGEWPPLAESTLQRKASQGSDDRILREEGDLFESATSPTGPYSYMVPTDHGVVIGIDWQENGWQIPQVLSQGAGDGRPFPGRGNWSLPARPIYPPAAEMVAPVGAAIMDYLRVVR